VEEPSVQEVALQHLGLAVRAVVRLLKRAEDLFVLDTDRVSVCKALDGQRFLKNNNNVKVRLG
jgi:hypothetical protein